MTKREKAVEEGRKAVDTMIIAARALVAAESVYRKAPPKKREPQAKGSQ